MSYKKICKNNQPVRKEDKKDGKVKYRYKIRCYDAQGREINRNVLAANDREAKLIEDELKADSSICELCWVQAATIFCEEHEGMRTAGYLKDLRRAAADLAGGIGNKLLEKTSAKDMAGYLQSIRETPRKANLQRSMLLSIGRYMRKTFRVSSLPFIDTPKVEYTPEKRVPFTLEEIGAHYSALSPCVRLVFRFLALSGCRVTAACLLREEDISESAITLHEKGMRGRKKIRQLILDENLREVLTASKNWKAQNSIFSEYAFVNSRGNPWTAVSLDHNVKKAWHRAGLVQKEVGRPHVLHELRHAYGTLAGQMNLEADMIAASLGHASRHTSEIYTHHDARMALEAGKLIRPRIAEKLKMPEAS